MYNKLYLMVKSIGTLGMVDHTVFIEEGED